MKKNLIFRAWFYFRQGWATYFAFLLAALNTMVTTYYLAIKDIPFLKEIFPSFYMYIAILSAVGIPILTIVGYVHFKRSAAFKAEAQIGYESNPYWKRMVANTEATLALNLKMSEILIKISKNEKISVQELEQISEIQKDLRNHIDDLDFKTHK